MPATTVLDKPVEIIGGQVVIDGHYLPFEAFEVPIATGGGPVTVWLDRQRDPDSSALAVLSSPSHGPILFEVSASAVEMFLHCSRQTMVTWMCHAAAIDDL
jgi:hypothetical protein